MSRQPVRVITNMEIDEISLVDIPANQHAKVAIAKRASEEDTVPEEIYDETGTAIDFDALEPGQVVFDAEGNAFAVEVDDEYEEELEPVGKAFRTPSFSDAVRESLSKALNDADRDEVIAKAAERISEAEARAERAELIAKSERDLRLEREYTEVAKGYNVPIEPTALGPVLMRMAETMSYDDCAVIHKALSASGEALYAEVGYIGGGDNYDPMAMVEAQIEGALSKSAGGADPIAKAAATAEFFAQNPAAYDDYVASKRG